MKLHTTVTKTHTLTLDREDLIRAFKREFEIPPHAEISVNSGSPDDGSFETLEISWETSEDH